MWPDQTYYTTKDMVTGRYKAHKLKGEEVAHVEQVRTTSSRGQFVGSSITHNAAVQLCMCLCCKEGLPRRSGTCC